MFIKSRTHFLSNYLSCPISKYEKKATKIPKDSIAQNIPKNKEKKEKKEKNIQSPAVHVSTKDRSREIQKRAGAKAVERFFDNSFEKSYIHTLLIEIMGAIKFWPRLNSREQCFSGYLSS